MSKLIMERIEELVLARLSTAPKKIRESQVEKQLYPYVEACCTAPEWRVLLSVTLERLASAGEIEKKPLRLSDAGRKRVLRAFGLSTMPQGGWRELKTKSLPAKAMGVSAGQTRKRPLKGELTARILKRSYELDVSETPGRQQAIDALVKRELGFSIDGQLSLEKIRAHVLAKLLDASPKLGSERLSNLLAASAVGARKPETAALQLALVRRWVMSSSSAVPTADNGAGKSANSADLDSFSARVLETARAPSTKRFGDRKAFIFSVWQQISQDPQFAALGEPRFKECLVEANRRGLLTLSRADLVGAMDSSDVSRSEVRHLTATFHFINVD